MTTLNLKQHGFTTAQNLSFAPILLAYVVGALPILLPVALYRLLRRAFS